MSDQEKAWLAAAVVAAWLVWRGRGAAGEAIEGARNWTTDTWAQLSGLDAHQNRLMTDPLYAQIERAGVQAWRWPWELEL